MTIRSTLLILGPALMFSGLAAAQDNACDAGEAPDIILGGFTEINRYGNINGITSFSVGTESCNVGTCEAAWNGGGSSQHPVIGQNLFRLEDGRFEQIGQSWLKHGFATFSLDLCSEECIPTAGQSLGVNCSDPYEAALNGSQKGLGPKRDIDTGDHDHPFTEQGQFGDAIYKRLQVHDSDLDPAGNAGALYYVEGQYVASDDTSAGNHHNNLSYQQVNVFGNTSFNMALVGSIVQEQPALHAWQGEDPGVALSAAVPGYWIGSRVTDLGNGTWHYEYAVQNVTDGRAIRALTLPLPHGVTLTNIGFHDVDYHSGDPFSGEDWAVTVESGDAPNSITWSTAAFADDADANALCWGTLYNFRFDADVSPTTGQGTLEYFVPGTPAAVSWSASCSAGDTDYAVYRGELGAGGFSDHRPLACSTSGSTGEILTPVASSGYYLIVPANKAAEGSYGRDSGGTARAQSPFPCAVQFITGCN